MISTPTTFVVGAGASHAYGLPIARGLRDQAQKLVPGGDAYQLLLAAGVDALALNDVLRDLEKHPAESIDGFLESRQDRPEVLRIGKLLIAALMGVATAIAGQGQGSSPPVENDWLAYVLEKMRRGASRWEDFAQGNADVRFVTFNFDSIIEDRLSRAVTSIYRGQNIHVGRVLERIPIIHVHGRLPPIPALSKRFDLSSSFKQQEWIAWTKAAASTINVVLEAIDPATRAQASAAVARDGVLCFLGFAFDPDNLVRLNIPNMLRDTPRPAEMYGSAFGLLEGEQIGVRRRFLNQIQLGGQGDGCRQVLRMFDIFKD